MGQTTGMSLKPTCALSNYRGDHVINSKRGFLKRLEPDQLWADSLKNDEYEQLKQSRQYS